MSGAIKINPQTEADWQRTVTDTLDLFGWTWTHFKPARTPDGKYLTRIAGNKGFPDIAAVRERFLVIEVKAEKGTLSPEQKHWRDSLKAAGIEYHVFRPSNFDAMMEILRRDANVFGMPVLDTGEDE